MYQQTGCCLRESRSHLYQLNRDTYNDNLRPLTKYCQNETFHNQTNIFTYYGSNATHEPIETFLSNPDNVGQNGNVYNVINCSFLNFNYDGELVCVPSLNNELCPINVTAKGFNFSTFGIESWKSKPDLWGRKKYVLLTIGGTRFTPRPTEKCSNRARRMINALKCLFKSYAFDGFDLKLEVDNDNECDEREYFDSWKNTVVKYFNKYGFINSNGVQVDCIITTTPHATNRDIGSSVSGCGSDSGNNGSYLGLTSVVTCSNVQFPSLCNRTLDVPMNNNRPYWYNVLRQFRRNVINDRSNGINRINMDRFGILLPTNPFETVFIHDESDQNRFREFVEQLKMFSEIKSIGIWALDLNTNNNVIQFTDAICVLLNYRYQKYNTSGREYRSVNCKDCSLTLSEGMTTCNCKQSTNLVTETYNDSLLQMPCGGCRRRGCRYCLSYSSNNYYYGTSRRNRPLPNRPYTTLGTTVEGDQEDSVSSSDYDSNYRYRRRDRNLRSRRVQTLDATNRPLRSRRRYRSIDSLSDSSCSRSRSRSDRQQRRYGRRNRRRRILGNLVDNSQVQIVGTSGLVRQPNNFVLPYSRSRSWDSRWSRDSGDVERWNERWNS